MDDDGYPTEDELKALEEFVVTDTNLTEFFKLLRECWNYAEWGWHEDDLPLEECFAGTPTKRYRISTGGWSGNEDAIRAFESNWLAWSMSWYSSRVGGHYEFHVKVP